MKILLTNDDGIYAQGIAALHKTLSRVGTVTVVAPDREKSSVGHGITLAHPIFYKKVSRKGRFFGYGVSGTPADCVKFAAGVLLKDKPDLIVSGINLGPNDGCSVAYSGTVAGAREGAMMGIPSLAVSLATFVRPDYEPAAKVSARLARQVLARGLPPGTFLNVNVPHCAASRIKGVRVTRQGTVPIHGCFTRRVDPLLREYYWMAGKSPELPRDLNMDTYALSKRYVTVTPIRCDMTDVSALADLSDWPLK